nr:uncharacterized protein LOC110382865 [Helicoverpa armigera]
MDALRVFCGFFLTTWLVRTLTILLLNVDLEKFWIPTISLSLNDPCMKIWTLYYFGKLFVLLINMNASKCCVRNCKNTRPDTTLHKFPDPEKELDRFNSWIFAIGGNVLMMDPKSIFKNGRICHSHFNPKFYTASKRLSKNAIPSLFLSGVHSSLPVQPAPSIVEQPTPSTSKGTTRIEEN